MRPRRYQGGRAGALPRDLLPFPITTGSEVIGSKGGDKPWTEAQVATAEHYARPVVARDYPRRQYRPARFRPDPHGVVRHRNNQRPPGINVTQHKTGVQLWIPMTQELMAAVETWERRPAPFLLKPTGEPWRTREQLTMAWDHERARNKYLAPCADMVLHGLRATACVRLKRAGANEIQISDMVGLSEPMVRRYCRFSVQKENAMAAVHHLDRTAAEREVGIVTTKVADK